MIVKNESAVIARCLESVIPHIDAWVISDTGSTDNTRELVRELLKGTPGELRQDEWVDFSTNRNLALEAARRQDCDYILLIDADEQLVTDPGFSLRDLDADTYSAQFEIISDTPQQVAPKWHRKFLVKSSLPVKYEGLLDEVIMDTGLDNRLLENCVVRSYLDGARSSDGLVAKFKRDAEVLRKAIEKDPDEPRNWFYLAQRLAGAGEIEEAIRAYRTRVEIEGGFQEERYYSLFQIANYRKQRGDDYRDVARSYLEAYRMRPTRAEPLAFLAVLHAEHGEPELAELYARAAARMPEPQDSLLVLSPIYAWAANDTLAGALAEQGKLREARELLTKMLALPQVPDSEKPRIAENVELIRKNEAEQEAEQAQQQPLGPDERTYLEQADALRTQGLRGLRGIAKRFINRPAMQALPNPARWGWIGFLALTRHAPWIGLAASVLLAGLIPALPGWTIPLLATSPLLGMLGRRKLSDTTVAALTLLALGLAHHGEPAWLALALCALLACREASMLLVPAIATAWLLGGNGWPGLALAVAGGVSAWAGLTAAILGPRLAWTVLRKASGGHATPYTLAHQRGAPHRLLVDLAILSPIPLGLALLGSGLAPELTLVAVALLVPHMFAPVRNVRLVLAAELLMRGMAALTLATFGWPASLVLAAAWVAYDVWLTLRLRHAYDPTTETLSGELGMTRMPSRA